MSIEDEVLVSSERLVPGTLYVLCHSTGLGDDRYARNGDVVMACTSTSESAYATGAVVLRSGYLLVGLLGNFLYVKYTPKEV